MAYTFEVPTSVDEAPAIAALLNAGMDEAGFSGVSIHMVERDIERGNVIVAKAKGGVVGAMRFGIDGTIATPTVIAVHPDFRRQGIAVGFHRFAWDVLRERGFTLVRSNSPDDVGDAIHTQLGNTLAGTATFGDREFTVWERAL